jgi:alanine-synthesizing transaminase
VPTFVLSGLSKVAALPQMKAAWMACFAEPEALQRLEVIGDTFLSMSAPVQHALPAWLSERARPQEQIRKRLEHNLATLDAILLRQTLISRLDVEGGWYVVLRVPGLQSEEETALELLRKRAVVVHPGGFFGFSGQGWLVVSLLAPEEEFTAGGEAIVTYFVQLSL